MDTYLPLGGTFAGLNVESLVGRGGMGVVYRARQIAPARTVALKVLAPELDGDAVARQRFLAEIELLAAVEHPHVVPMYGAGETEGRLWLTMRLLQGPSLARLVERRGPLRPDRAVELLAPIASALDAIHAAGLVHGDVGPANVLLDLHGEPYLTDFGIARRLGAPAERLGTLAYLAPERISDDDEGGSADVNPDSGGAAADRYAFAGLVLFALTATPPFGGPTPDAVLRAHLDAPPPLASERRADLPRALDPVIARGLAKEPGERYPTATALLDAVRVALSFAPIADPDAETRPVGDAVSSARDPRGAWSTGAATTAARSIPGAVPARPGGRPRTRRIPSGSLAGAVLGLVAVLLVTGSVFGFGLVPVTGVGPAAARSADPTGGSGANVSTPRPTPTPTPTPRPTASPRLGDAGDVARLRAFLPAAARSDCRSAPLEGGAFVAAGGLATPNAVAAVECALGSDGSARYVLFESESGLDRTWDSTIGKAGIGSDGRCETGSPFDGQWRTSTGILGLGPSRTGRLACWLGRTGDARIDWTLDGLPVLATLLRGDEDIAAAYARWERGDLTPEPLRN